MAYSLAFLGEMIMALENFNKEEIEAFKEQLLDHVPDNGRAIGNITLRDNKLHWNKEKYSAVKNLLIKEGKLELGRGKGGSVKLPPSSVDDANADAQKDYKAMPDPGAQKALVYANEDALYEPMLKVLQEDWVAEQNSEGSLIEKTARNGAKPDGKWSRPDLTVLAHTAYPYIRGKIFDVISFEIKYRGSLDVTAVYEALSHKKAATKSYVLAWISEAEGDVDIVSEVANAARRHGVGLITAEDPKNYDTWQTVVDAVRDEPDPAELNRFLANQISKESQDQWRKWLQ